MSNVTDFNHTKLMGNSNFTSGLLEGFNTLKIIEITLSLLFFIIGGTTNIYVFIKLWCVKPHGRRRKRNGGIMGTLATCMGCAPASPTKREPTSIRSQVLSRRFIILQKHLNLTDLMVVLIYTVHSVCCLIANEWLGGDFLCRLMAFVNTLGFHASSNVIACIALDRLFNVLAMRSVQGSTRKRSLRMLAIAWVAGVVCSAPQLIVWRTYALEGRTTHCTTVFNVYYYEHLGRVHPWEAVYSSMHLVLVFFIPASIVTFSYGVVMMKIIGENRKRRLSTIGISASTKSMVSPSLCMAILKELCCLKHSFAGNEYSMHEAETNSPNDGNSSRIPYFSACSQSSRHDSESLSDTPLRSPQRDCNDKFSTSSKRTTKLFYNVCSCFADRRNNKSSVSTSLVNSDQYKRRSDQEDSEDSARKCRQNSLFDVGSIEQYKQERRISWLVKFNSINQTIDSNCSDIDQPAEDLTQNSCNDSLNATRSVSAVNYLQIPGAKAPRSPSCGAITSSSYRNHSRPSISSFISSYKRVKYSITGSNSEAYGRSMIKSRTYCLTAVIVASYILCWLPYNCLSLIRYLDLPYYTQHAKWIEIMYKLIILNSVINPFIYIIFVSRAQAKE